MGRVPLRAFSGWVLLSRIVALTGATLAIAGLWTAVAAATVDPTATPSGTPVVLSVTGIADATNVSGTDSIGVGVTSGTATQVQLLVDDKTEVTVTTPPYTLAWDTTKESSGIHTVTVRATFANGQTSEKKFVVEVIAPTSTAIPAVAATVQATALPISTPKPPEATATTLTAADATTNSGTAQYAAAGVGLIVVVGAIAWGLYALTKRAPAAIVPSETPPPKISPPAVERTVVIEKPRIAPVNVEGTIVSGGNDGAPVISARPKRPSARLRIVQQGIETSIVITQSESILGREASNPIVVHDPQASRKHARIVIENGEFWYEDLKSLNGSKINDELVTSRRKLAPDDRIKIGEAVLTFTPE